jgi:ferrochelatase
MKINSIIDVIEAKLLNQPSITSIKNIHFDIKKIKQGDMLISDNLSIDEIKEAIGYGAYAIVFENDDIKFEEIDNEIAWIKATNIQDATVKLLRFGLSNVHFMAYYVSPVQIEYLKCLSYNDKNLVFLDDDIAKDFEKLKSITKETFLFGCNDKFMTKIYPMTTSFKPNIPRIDNLTIHSPFETSFTLDENNYSHIKVAKIYLNDFIASLSFLKEQGFYKDLKGLKNFEYFKPIFINKDCNEVEYGASNKILILQKDSTILEYELRYISQSLSYAKVITILPLYFKSKFDYEDSFYYEDVDEVKNILKNENYEFAYIFIKNYDEIVDKITISQSQLSLF